MNNFKKKEYNKEELEDILYRLSSEKAREREEGEVLLFLEVELCNYVREMVKIKQKNLKNISFLDCESTVATWNGIHQGGCIHCLQNGFVPLRISTKCQLNCKFCYEFGKYTVPLTKNQVEFHGNLFSFSSLKVLLEKQDYLYSGIGWASRGEPLLEMEKIEEIMPFISNLGKYQWLYTNGLLATEDNIKKLKSYGLNEIRFDLQATNFSEEVIKNIEIATKYLNRVVIETPMYTISYQNFIKNIDRLSKIVHYYNIPELQVFPNNMYNFLGSEGILYKHNRGYVSPVSSILYIYDFLEFLENKNYDITVNVCSNSTKYYRGCSSKYAGLVQYDSHIEYLPIQSYLFIINEYFEKSGNECWEIF